MIWYNNQNICKMDGEMLMIIEDIQLKDMEQVKKLSPKDWGDITPIIKYYIHSSFCFPMKVCIDKKIVGIGTGILHDQTAWLAHIIVHSQFRNQGIGSKIVQELINIIRTKGYSTISLIATESGFPVYKKAGFREITRYQFLVRDQQRRKTYSKSNHIVAYQEKYKSDLLSLDATITGEERSNLLVSCLSDCCVYLKDSRVTGFYMPNLGEGMIVADDAEAGIELMKIKYSTCDKAVLPIENRIGIEFLKENGFSETIQARKMILGEEILWEPSKIYSRIGGNLG